MNTITKLGTYATAIIMLLVCTACNKDLIDINYDVEEQWNSCELVLESGLQSRAGDQSPKLKTGDALAIRFTDKTKKVTGYAIYNDTTKIWNVRYKGELSTGDGKKCEVIYLGNQPALDDDLKTISLTAQDAIYESNDGIYVYDGKTMHIAATLVGKTARIKFTHTTTTSFSVKGLAYYKSFDFSTWKFGRSEAYTDEINVSTKSVGASFESNYIYVDLPLREAKYEYVTDSRIWIKSGNYVYVYNKELKDLVKPSNSGTIRVPTQSSHSGWNTDTYKTKTFSNISVTSKSSSTDGWSQTQNSHKFSSKTGVYLTFDNILSTGWYSSSGLSEDFYGSCVYDGKEDGVSFDNDMWSISGGNIVKGQSYHYAGMIYIPDATYYYFQFFTRRLTYKMTNITMSNF